MKDEKDDLRGRTKAFALRIIALYQTLPKSGSAHVLGHQVLRSGTSVGANFREAHRARSNAEFVSKVGDCLKELEETAYWLELIGEAEILPVKRLEALQAKPRSLLLFW